MIFEPPSDADPHAGSQPGSSEETGIDDQWPDEPPTAAPLLLATIPPAAPVPTAMPAKEPTRGEGARRGTRWVAVGMLTLIAAGAGLRVYRSARRSVATANPPTPATSTSNASATATASAPLPDLPSSPPPVDDAPAPSALAPQATAFDAVAAKQALDATAYAVARCRRGSVFGPAHAIVTFGNDGAVRRCAVSPPFLGTAAGMCVAKALAQARVPEFAGTAGTIVHHFVVPAR
jgi:hypothetical protein